MYMQIYTLQKIFANTFKCLINVKALKIILYVQRSFQGVFGSTNRK